MSPLHPRTLMLILVAVVLILVGGAFAFFSYITSSPSFEEGGATLQIKRGMSVEAIAQEAKASGIVRSPLVLYTILTYSYDPTKIYAGTYRFEQPHDVFEVARKLARSEVDDTLTSVTLPEGVTRKDMARIIKAALPAFDDEKFLALTKNNEGYLFPETYFVPEEFTAEEFVTLLTETFTSEFSSYKDAINASDLSSYEIIILASILEREANDEASMKMVSGILQNRLEVGMALQADATIGYVLDKPISELKPEDLDTDTPYNTYLYPGLTPTPIGNPGSKAIEAVLYPTKSDNFYYITGDDGNFYYAETFDEHRKNIREHLR